MAEQTTGDGVTVEQIDSAYHVLEVVRENLKDDGLRGLASVVNETHNLVQRYEERADWSNDYDLPEPGDVLRDPESPEFSEGLVTVKEVLDKQSQLHFVEVEGGKRSVSYLNPEHPPDAPVVVGQYVEGSEKEYAFPVTRLEEA